MKVIQINTTANITSTGRIAEGIGQALLKRGHESYIASAKIGPSGSKSQSILIGSDWDLYMHGMKTRITDKHGFGSKKATEQLINDIECINPDVISLHNLHGYYLNVEVLFNYLKNLHKPVVWTLHDCWSFTGHCSHFEFVSCDKWKTECSKCPLYNEYPSSWFLDNSRENYAKKKELFNSLDNLTIVTPSLWLKNLLCESFLSAYPVELINNGIDLQVFKPQNAEYIRAKYNLLGKEVLLGVAGVWSRIKGLKYFIELSKRLDDRFKIVLIGLAKAQIKSLPDNIIGIPRTENLGELVAFYNTADIFINPTLVDNFPTTNLEALACGTPVITFNTGGSPEAVDEHTGIVVARKDVDQLYDAIVEIMHAGKDFYASACRKRAIEKYDQFERFEEYVRQYEDLLGLVHQPEVSLLQEVK